MRIAAGLLLLLGGLLVAILAAEDRRPRADIVFAQSADAFTLDPQRMTYQQDLRLARALYEGLVRTDPDTAEPRPAAASAWTVSPDGLDWTFEIDPAARWSDGSPVSSRDFREGLLRALLPDTAADYSGLLMPIRGAEAFFAWRSEALAAFDPAAEDAESLWRRSMERFDETVGIACPDERTLRIELERPVPYFLGILAFPLCSPIHRPTLAAHTRLDPATGRLRTDAAWTKAGTLVSNGPYLLARRRYQRDIRLERNPHFRDPSRPRSESIEAVVIADPATAMLAFHAGEIDWLTDVGAAYRADLLAEERAFLDRHRPAFEAAIAAGLDPDAALAALPSPQAGERRDVHPLATFGTDFFHFNCRETLADGRPNPFADPRVRRAFALATDRRALVERVTRLREPEAASLVPAGAIPGYEPPAGLPFDPDAARRELAAAGWIDRDGEGLVEDVSGRLFQVIDLLFTTGPSRYRDLSLALRSMWQAALGVEIEARGQEPRFYKDDLRRGRFMIARGGWYGDYLDPMTFLDLCRTGDGNNVRGYSNPAFDRLLEQADRTADPAARMAILQAAERILVEEDLPLLPLCRYLAVYAYDPVSLRGLVRHPMLDQRLDRLRLVGEGDVGDASR